MRQIPLDLTPAEPASFDNYVPGSNAEALALLRRLAAGSAGEHPSPWRCPSVWLWGEPGAGKTHLIRALAAAAGERAILLGPGDDLERFAVARERAEVAPERSTASGHPEVAPERSTASRRLATAQAAPVVIVDDCDRLDAARQEATFHLYNRLRADPGASFVATGGQPPLALALRDDLRTRLGWGVVLRLGLLTDEEKAEALRRAARARGFTLPDELIRYLLTQHSRDIRWLLRRLEALDRFALERKRAITLPLLRELEGTEALLK